jgi:hypothetical protein
MGIVTWFKRRLRRQDRDVEADDGATTRAFDPAATGGFGGLGSRSNNRDDPFAAMDR